ncbi:helix-turn-helix domain-containing protein [Sphingobacterium paludis]|uniref:Helix-turn-helix protein n=1 Tax=Sphingobacterium paludis TaxID=1476465 RepID=A0A4R7CWR9_9SPHI|nr:helix-turn-helix transcriptional regulator [Sphingobacterium paludis]TDS08961.1 helix-turn-helix protein [Sphingobacterium paludis]
MFNAVKIIDVKNSIGEFTRNLRKQRGLTQDDLASQLGLSRLTILKVESGANFKIDTLLLIFQYFDELATLNDFFKNHNNKFGPIKSLY